MTALTAPAAGTAGRTITVANTVRNQGPAAAGAFQVTFYMSATDATPGAGTPVGSRTVSSLAAGAASAASTTITIPAGFVPGAYYLSAIADSGAAAVEVSETNNGTTTTLAVMAMPTAAAMAGIAP